MRVILTALVVSCLMTAMHSVASAQGRPNPAVLAKAQRVAMSRLAFMDGAWRGTAETVTPSGEMQRLTQTERVGPFLDGAVKVVEGRGYKDDGTVEFNALGVISYEPATEEYNMRSYTMGRAGDFEISPTDDGFQWEIPAGPWTIRYTAVITDSTWYEVGDRLSPDGQSYRFFEMNLDRVGDSDWPTAGVVGAETDPEKAAVEEVLFRSYVEGVHAHRDVEAIQAGFHPDFVMQVFRDGALTPVSLDMWLDRMKPDGTPNPAKIDYRIERIDVTGNTATATLQLIRDGAPLYTDNFGLYKFDDGWKIVSKTFFAH